MAKSSRPPSSKSKPPAASVPLSAPASEPAPRTPALAAAPAAAAVPPEPIEQQVEALIDQAQQQAQAIADLASSDADDAGDRSPRDSAPASDTPAPPGPSQSARDAGPPAAGAPDVSGDAAAEAAIAGQQTQPAPAESPPANSAEENAAARSDQPVDPVALQSQVDAILSEVGYPVNAEDASAPPGASESEAKEKSPSDGESGAAPDIAEVDAVIAEAARLALEDDSFDSGESAQGELAREPGAAESHAAEASRPKDGDVSMRRDKRERRVQKGADLDGEFPGPAPIAPPATPAEVDADDEDSLEFALPPTEGTAPPGSGWKQRLGRGTLSLLAAANAPWHAWPPITRAAILALTIGNGLLALVAFAVVLRRLVS